MAEIFATYRDGQSCLTVDEHVLSAEEVGRLIEALSAWKERHEERESAKKASEATPPEGGGAEASDSNLDPEFLKAFEKTRNRLLIRATIAAGREIGTSTIFGETAVLMATIRALCELLFETGALDARAFLEKTKAQFEEDFAELGEALKAKGV